MNRRAFLGAAACASHCWARTDESARAVRRGVAYLLNRQSRDGGWNSTTYGLLRSGQSLTPLVLNALLDAGVTDSRPLARATAFIERNARAEGALGLSDAASADYPCYATALALRAAVRTHGPNHPLAPRMIAWLRSRQMSAENGWTAAHAAFGAWGLGGARRSAPDSGHVDLSMTRHVLEALAQAGISPPDPAMASARVFVQRCRNADGSYFFSPVETGANKAGATGDGFAGYGTATADGLLSLIASGSAVTDEDVLASLQWLRERDHPALSPGFPTEARRRYAEGLRYYYADAAVRAFRAMGQSRAVPFAAALRETQGKGGSWVNSESLVKEDDPLIATAFAVSALAMG